MNHTFSRPTIRQQIRFARRQLTSAEQQAASDVVYQKLINHPQIQKANTIAGYLANDGELDLSEFFYWCWQQGKQVYLPVLHPFAKGHLLFLRYQANTLLIANQFNIPEPTLNVQQLCPLAELEVLLTPLVAFDDNGNRLGMGGGFYDRTLSHWHRQIIQGELTAQPHPIGIAHDCQKIPQIPTEHWDIALPEIISPSYDIKLGN